MDTLDKTETIFGNQLDRFVIVPEIRVTEFKEPINVIEHPILPEARRGFRSIFGRIFRAGKTKRRKCKKLRI